MSESSVFLPPGYTITFTANALSAGEYSNNNALTAVAAGASSTVGPFADGKNYVYRSKSGQMTYSFGVAGSAAVTSVSGTSNQIAASSTTGDVILSLPSGVALTAPAIGTPASGNLSNCVGLPIAGGGTGVSSAPAAPVASNFAAWDANKNISANNFMEAFTTTATASQTTTLTVASTYNQFFTGSTAGQVVQMPVVATLPALGVQYYIYNASSQNITVQSSGGNSIQVMAANTRCILTYVASGTGAASWNSEYIINTQTGSGSVVLNTSPSLVTPAIGAATGTSLALSNSGILDTNGNVALALSATASAVNGFTLTNTTGTGSPIIAATGTGANLIATVKGKGTGGVTINGTTAADNAAAGYVGEIISSAVTAQAISTGTLTNVTSISLTAGDWDVDGNILTVPAASTTQSFVQACINVTSAARDNGSLGGISASLTASNGTGIQTGKVRVNVSSTTTYYLVAYVAYAVSTLTINGTIQARRVR